MDVKCERCGSGRLEEARLEGMALTLDRAATLKKVFNAGGQVRCRVCVGCGALSALSADPQELAKMLS